LSLLHIVEQQSKFVLQATSLPEQLYSWLRAELLIKDKMPKQKTIAKKPYKKILEALLIILFLFILKT